MNNLIKKIKIIFGFIFFVIFLSGTSYSWEHYDMVLAVVNSSPIVESEVLSRYKQISRLKKIPRDKVTFEKSRVLDKYIEDALVYETAEMESIIISDLKVFSHIEKMISQYFRNKIKKGEDVNVLAAQLAERLKTKFKNEKIEKNDKLDAMNNQFIKSIEKVQKIKFNDFIYDVRTQMRREQVLQIAIGISPPTKKEALAWYEKNKKKLGYEVRVKHILIKSRKKSITEERKANKIISDLRKKIIRGGSFEKIARKYSQDPGSVSKGGDLGWVMLQELDPYFAGNVFRMKKIGQISKVFKSNYGYHIVKYLGRRSVSFKKVQNLILYRLYNQRMMGQFKKWVSRRKRESEIKIHMKDYVKG